MRAFETEKTDVAEVDRSIYDIKDAANAAFEVSSGLTPEIVEKISEEKHDPEWMRIFRLKALETYNKMPVQNWGPSIAKCPTTSRTPLSVWASPRPSAPAWPVSVLSMTPRWFTTTSRLK